MPPGITAFEYMPWLEYNRVSSTEKSTFAVFEAPYDSHGEYCLVLKLGSSKLTSDIT